MPNCARVRHKPRHVRCSCGADPHDTANPDHCPACGRDMDALTAWSTALVVNGKTQMVITCNSLVCRAKAAEIGGVPTCDRCGEVGDHRCRGFRIKTRGSAAGLPIAAEYLCPMHGRFTADAIRDANGDAPAEAKCPTVCRLDEAFTVAGSEVTVHAYRTTDDPRARCGRPSPFAISAPVARVKLVEVVRGGYEKPERETWTNTENLGEGQDIDDWQDERDKVWERDRENSIKEILNDR